MRYTGENADAFERDVKALLARPGEEYGVSLWEPAVRDLARRYGIGDSEIWDILPEYEEAT